MILSYSNIKTCRVSASHERGAETKSKNQLGDGKEKVLAILQPTQENLPMAHGKQVGIGWEVLGGPKNQLVINK